MNLKAVLSSLIVFGMVAASYGAPGNDNFANRTILQGATVDFAATLEGASFEAGESDYSSFWLGFGGGSVWWSWTPNVSGFATIQAQTPDRRPEWYPEFLVYATNSLAGANINTLIAASVVSSNFPMAFRVTAGQTYSLVLVGDSFTNVPFSFHLQASAGPIFLRQPADQTVEAGGSAWFSAYTPFVSGQSTRWQFNGSDINVQIGYDTNGAPVFEPLVGAAVSINNVTTNSAGEYRAIIWAYNEAGALMSSTSQVARLTVTGQDVHPTIALRRLSTGTNSFGVTISGETNQTYLVHRAFRELGSWQEAFIPGRFFTNGQERILTDFSEASSGFFKAFRAGDFRSRCIANLHRIDFAKAVWAATHKKEPGSFVVETEVNQSLDGFTPSCPLGGAYSYNNLGALPTCSIEGHSL